MSKISTMPIATNILGAELIEVVQNGINKRITVTDLIGNAGGGSDGKSAYQIAVDTGFVGSQTEWISSLAGAAGATGAAGQSAYDLAVLGGYVGSQAAWLASLHGTNGTNGAQGAKGDTGDVGAAGPAGSTAYQVALQGGFIGTQTEWLNSLKGAKGDPGDRGLTGPTGANGTNGSSAYDIAIAAGFVGNQATWLASLKGVQGNAGAAGTNGTNGISAYQVAVDNGFVGNESAWLISIRGGKGDTGNTGPAGPQGIDGKTAYQTAVDNGFVGNQVQWLASLVGPQGATGAQGLPGSQGIQGPAGAAGAAGVQGSQGVAGTNGTNGAAGPQGIQGLKGDTGNTGATGPQGIQGIQGPIGPQGIQGLTGATGATGPQGPAGDGTSAEMTLTTTLKSLIYPTISLRATLLTGTGITTVQVLDQNNGVVGSFNLDTIGVPVQSGYLSNLAGQLKYVVTLGSGTFSLVAVGATGAQGPVGPAGSIGATGPKGDQGDSNADMALSTTLKTLLYPTVNIRATLLSGTGTTVVQVKDQLDVVIGTFTLDSVGTPVQSGFLSNLAGQLKYAVVSGTGVFSVVATGNAGPVGPQGPAGTTYAPPLAGIPLTDMAAAAQTLINGSLQATRTISPSGNYVMGLVDTATGLKIPDGMEDNVKVISSERFGIYPDGSDVTAKLKAMFVFMKANGIKRATFKPGVYVYSSTIDAFGGMVARIPGTVRFHSNSQLNVGLTGTSYSNSFEFQNENNVEISGCEFTTAVGYTDGLNIVEASTFVRMTNVTNFKISDCVFRDTNSGCFLLRNCQHGLVLGCIAKNLGKDAFHITGSSHAITVAYCYVANGGDDAFPVVGYLAQSKPYDILHLGCVVAGVKSGRGFAYVGCHKIRNIGCKVYGLPPSEDVEITNAATVPICGLYIASESGFTTYGVKDIQVQGMELYGCGGGSYRAVHVFTDQFVAGTEMRDLDIDVSIHDCGNSHGVILLGPDSGTNNPVNQTYRIKNVKIKAKIYNSSGGGVMWRGVEDLKLDLYTEKLGASVIEFGHNNGGRFDLDITSNEAVATTGGDILTATDAAVATAGGNNKEISRIDLKLLVKAQPAAFDRMIESWPIGKIRKFDFEQLYNSNNAVSRIYSGNPAVPVLTLPSTVAWVNLSTYTRYFNVAGGTVSAVEKATALAPTTWSTLTASSGTTYPVAPGESFRVTYSVAPVITEPAFFAASGGVWVNSLQVPVIVGVLVGTVTLIEKAMVANVTGTPNWTALPIINGYVTVPPGEGLRVTYSSAPTVTMGHAG